MQCNRASYWSKNDASHHDFGKIETSQGHTGVCCFIGRLIGCFIRGLLFLFRLERKSTSSHLKALKQGVPIRGLSHDTPHLFPLAAVNHKSCHRYCYDKSTCTPQPPPHASNAHCYNTLRRISLVQVSSNGVQRLKSIEEEARLREELKRTQEALSFLSAWDEEKNELDAEVPHPPLRGCLSWLDAAGWDEPPYVCVEG